MNKNHVLDNVYIYIYVYMNYIAFATVPSWVFCCLLAWKWLLFAAFRLEDEILAPRKKG